MTRTAGLGRFVVTLLSLYAVGRAVAEPFVIDFGDPSTYAADWGGPHLLGVLAVHCGPGVLGAAWLVHLTRRATGATR